MVVGYVLINTSPGSEHQVYDELRKVVNIAEVHPLFGEHDLLVKIDIDDYNKLGNIVIDQIRTIEGVEDTKTLAGISF
ncbi:MAG: Lrp/AsnC ligand binding domain-containing protein [Thermoplasmata archaeon]|nr:Lrp/AsnC ligand binding domain-containing protein [Thermoplasmata archaeon]